MRMLTTTTLHLKMLLCTAGTLLCFALLCSALLGHGASTNGPFTPNPGSLRLYNCPSNQLWLSDNTAQKIRALRAPSRQSTTRIAQRQQTSATKSALLAIGYPGSLFACGRGVKVARSREKSTPDKLEMRSSTTTRTNRVQY